MEKIDAQHDRARGPKRLRARVDQSTFRRHGILIAGATDGSKHQADARLGLAEISIRADWEIIGIRHRKVTGSEAVAQRPAKHLNQNRGNLFAQTWFLIM